MTHKGLPIRIWLSRFRHALARVLPPRVWRAVYPIVESLGSPKARFFLSRSRFQNVWLQRPMRLLESGKFTNTHEQFAVEDLHLLRDARKTRMRVYFLWMFSTLAAERCSEGAIVFVGISYGTAAKTLSRVLDPEYVQRQWVFVDPFDGRRRHGDYNTVEELVRRDFADLPNQLWIKLDLVSALPQLPTIAFIHLNTTDTSAELSALDNIYGNMLPGALAVLDLYGWQTQDVQMQFTTRLEALGARFFELPTLQLVFWRPDVGGNGREVLPSDDTLMNI